MSGNSEVDFINCYFFSSENVDVWCLKVNAEGVKNLHKELKGLRAKRRSRPQPLLPGIMAIYQVIQGGLELAPKVGKWSRKMGFQIKEAVSAGISSTSKIFCTMDDH